MTEIKIEVRAIDLERLGINLCFINTDAAARKDVALRNAKRLSEAFASPPVAVQEEGDAKDAARWRFMRDNHFQYFMQTRHWVVTDADGRMRSEGVADSFEQAVDAAMKGDKP